VTLNKAAILLIFYGYLGVLSGGLQLYHSNKLPIITGLGCKLSIVAAILILIFNNHSTIKIKQLLALDWQKKIGFLGLLLGACSFILLISDYPYRGHSFIGGSSGIFFTLLGGVGAFALCLKLSGYPLVKKINPLALVIFFQFLTLFSFHQYVGNNLIFSDDHPSFLYRLILLGQHFPNIPFYNPAWNAGYSAREFFPSGILNIYLLLWPAISLLGDLNQLEVAKYYSYFIPFLFVFFAPLMMFLSARLIGLNSLTASIAAILSLAPTFSYFEFLLNYGTLSFCLAAALFPLSLFVAYRILFTDGYKQPALIVLAILVGFLGFTWHLMVIGLIPLALFAFLNFKLVFIPKRVLTIILVTSIVTALHFPSLKVLYQESNLKNLVSQDVLPGSVTNSSAQLRESNATRINGSYLEKIWESIESANKMFKMLVNKSNPLLLLLTLPGLLFVSCKKLRWIIFLTLVWLVFLAIFGEQLKPQFELRRMIIPACFLAIIPAAFFCYSFSSYVISNAKAKSNKLRFLNYIAAALLLGGVILAPFNSYRAYGNLSDEKFALAPDYLPGLIDAIKTHGGSGRTFFSGFILHELGAAHYDTQDGGHIAPLATFTGKPMYASHYYHVLWSTVDPIPPKYRKRKVEGIEEFLDLINATAVISFKREWAKYFLKNSNYQQVFQGGRFRLFTRKHSTEGYFLKGSGEVTTNNDGLSVIANEREVILKFRYLPKLRIRNSTTTEIYPVPVFEEEVAPKKFEQVNFIGLRVSEDDVRDGQLIEIGY
jgi:hypothetical protein